MNLPSLSWPALRLHEPITGKTDTLLYLCRRWLDFFADIASSRLEEPRASRAQCMAWLIDRATRGTLEMLVRRAPDRLDDPVLVDELTELLYRYLRPET